MADHNTWVGSIIKKFKEEVELIYTTVTPVYSLNGKVQYDNAPFTEPQNELWVELNVLPNTSAQASIGGDTNRDRTPGIALAIVRGPLNQGDANQYALCDFIKNAFRRTTFECVVFQVPSITRIGRVNNWWQIQVSCPFYVDDFK